jgi:putative ABC transport system permease protein
VGIDGQRTKLADANAVREHGRLTREFGLTFRTSLEQNERVVAGAFWDSPLAEPAAGTDTDVSISEEVRRDADVGVGDTMRFDLAGAVITARVTSIRKVGWDETQAGGFFFVLRPAPVIDRVGVSYVGFVEMGNRAEARGALQRDLVKAFPNVSAIDVSAVVNSIREIIDNVTLGVTIVGGITLVGGILIQVGAVAMTKFQRRGHLPDARRQHAPHRRDGRDRVRRPRPAGGAAGRGRRARPLVGARVLPVRHGLAAGARPALRGPRDHGCRGHPGRTRGQHGRARPEAPGHVAKRVM